MAKTLIVVLIILIYGGFQYYKNYTKTAKVNEQKKKEIKELQNLLEEVCRDINAYIQKYNNIQTEVSMIENKKREEIINKNDMDAYTELRIYTEEFNEKQELVSSLIDNVKEILDKQGDINDAFLINKQIKEELEELHHITEKIKYIEVQSRIQHMNHTKTSPQVSFFDGCNTKEEADKRYKSLSKAFHPDTGYGDTGLFQRMTDEYNNLKF